MERAATLRDSASRRELVPAPWHSSNGMSHGTLRGKCLSADATTNQQSNYQPAVEAGCMGVENVSQVGKSTLGALANDSSDFSLLDGGSLRKIADSKMVVCEMASRSYSICRRFQAFSLAGSREFVRLGNNFPL
jgi:hypothetical protein